MRQKIVKPAPYQFKVNWDDKRYEREVIELNFEPLIKEYALEGNYVLIHWQNKPYGVRRFGIYDGATDQYFGVDADKFSCELDDCKLELLQIDELKYVNIRPTAILMIHNAVVIYSGGEILIERAINAPSKKSEITEELPTIIAQVEPQSPELVTETQTESKATK